jgi:hypothetical protein
MINETPSLSVPVLVLPQRNDCMWRRKLSSRHTSCPMYFYLNQAAVKNAQPSLWLWQSGESKTLAVRFTLFTPLNSAFCVVEKKFLTLCRCFVMVLGIGGISMYSRALRADYIVGAGIINTVQAQVQFSWRLLYDRYRAVYCTGTTVAAPYYSSISSSGSGTINC